MTNVDEALLLQRKKCLANRRSTNAKRLHHLALRRELLTRRERAVLYRLDDLFGHALR